MTDRTQHDMRHKLPWRLIGWSIPMLLLLLPLVTGAPWTLSDYVVMGAMFLVAGMGVEFAVRASGDTAYRLAAATAIATAFLLVWVNLAVGFLGDEDNPANLIFIAVLAVAIGGAFLARFEAAAMTRAMLAAAAGQALAGVAGLAAGWASPGNSGIYEVVMGTSLFTGLWLVSAGLFGTAARRQRDREARP